MTNSCQHIYLSPHYDDASLSCGGAIHKQVQAGQSVLVVTVWAASPEPDKLLSPFAEELHAQWGNPEDVVATRRAEDRASMEILGADYLRLDFTDCIYRGRLQNGEWYYNNDAEIFGQIHPADLGLTDKIANAVVEMVPREDTVVVYAPLTVGNHVDHQLVHTAALQLRQQGWQIVFYEDYPYVDPGFAPHGQDNPYNLEATLLRLQQQANLRAGVRSFSEEDLQAKIDSIAAYASQMQILFGGRIEMENKVRHYALRVGGGSPAERVWIPG